MGTCIHTVWGLVVQNQVLPVHTVYDKVDYEFQKRSIHKLKNKRVKKHSLVWYVPSYHVNMKTKILGMLKGT